MAFLRSNFQRNREYLLGNDTRPAPSMDQKDRMQSLSRLPQDFTGGVRTGSGAAGGGALQATPEMDFRTTSAPQSTTQTEERRPDGTTKKTTTSTQPIFKTTGSLNQRLFNPLTAGAQAGQQQLQQAAEAFQQQAGPSRTFESIGGEQTLGRAVESGQGMDEARQLVGAQYTGPMGLDMESLADLQRLQEQLQTRQQALGTGGGLSTLIQQSAPGLTAGEARFEAKRLLPEAREQARDLGLEAVNPFVQALARGSEEAQAFAQQRQAEEDAIRQASVDLLRGRETGITGDIQRAIDTAAEQQRAAQEAYAAIQGATPEERLGLIGRAAPFLQSGTAEDPGEMLGQDVAEALFSPGARQTAEGRAAIQGVLNDPRYAAIKDIPILERSITKRGKGFYGLNDEDIRRQIPDKAKRALLYERQRELEKLAGGMRRPGEFSATNPIYGEEYQALDPSTYLGFDPGMSPSRENVSTEQQRTQFNRIQDLLGEMDRIGEAEPLRAARIYAQVGQYLEDEERNLEEKKGKETESDYAWKKLVKKARKEYKKQKAADKPYTQIADIFKGNINPFFAGQAAIQTGLYGAGKGGSMTGKALDLNPQVV